MPKASTSKATTASKAPNKKPAVKRKANAYQMPESIPLGMVFTDLSKQQWKIGPSIGVGGFGEIYCACKANESTKKYEDYQYVVKVEPHGNGPLFVEMHFYMRNAKPADIEAFKKKRNLKALGMPHFVGHGSHDLNEKKHRFVVMPRFGSDIWSLFLKNDRKMPLHTVYRLAIQMIDVYEYIHDCTYVHADLKATNMLLGLGKNGGHQAYLVDFGLASHFTTKDFKPDPKKMHNGTIEYTSRDAHQGVPTMRGDFEILAYNVIQWAGGELPWEKNKLLGTPIKVQQAKEELMSNIETRLKSCFASQQCTEPITVYLKYVSKLKYDEKPDYEKCRKIFVDGLKTLGKTNTGDLEFKTSSSSAASKRASAAAASPVKESRPKVGRPSGKSAAKALDNAENISPKGKNSRKRDVVIDSSEDSPSPSKKVRTNTKLVDKGKVSTQVRSTKASSGRTTTTTNSSVVVNNHVNKEKGTTNKTYNINLDLDISFDANVVVSVKRKKNKPPKPEPVDSPNQSFQSTDEIPPSDKSFMVQTTKVYKRAPRTSPRTK
ncbi:nucleosomal histone kinase 1 [Contarinia nasturtii]|uniref:nucleosomal histone kinase 1 n=1 Tax=Contarinia nasturtii TaxID=265458 RepID=UPI0012D3B9D9|nr:nucleosomal histone kinase 1 [Contarinia nasturtii]